MFECSRWKGAIYTAYLHSIAEIQGLRNGPFKLSLQSWNNQSNVLLAEQPIQRTRNRKESSIKSTCLRLNQVHSVAVGCGGFGPQPRVSIYSLNQSTSPAPQKAYTAGVESLAGSAAAQDILQVVQACPQEALLMPTG